MLGKLFLPLTIIIAVYDSIMGALDGYKESDEETWIGKIIDGLAGGITGLINSLIGIPLDFLLDALGWILGKMGFTGAEEALSNFSFAEEIGKIIDELFGYLKSAVKWVGTLFSDPVEALKLLWTGLVGEGGLLDILYAPIDAAIGWIMGIFGFDEPDTALTDEDGNFIGMKDLAINALRGVFNWLKSKLSFDIPGFDLPSLPRIKDILMNLLGQMLPDPEGGWVAKTFYKAADRLGFGGLREAAVAFQEGGSFENGTFTTGTDSDVNKIETNADLGLSKAQEEALGLEGSDKGSVNTTITKGGNITKGGDTFNQGDLGQTHTDPTALIGQPAWLNNQSLL